jgi:phospholipid/cholesterol/gamma-HCH transport system ATP-binding protein
LYNQEIFTKRFCSVAQGQLALHDVAMSFGSTIVLKKVSLEAAQGECVVLIGPSGEGKTVVLKLLAGLISPTAGRVLVGGRDLHGLARGEQEQLLLQMGMLFQKNALFDSLSAGENIAFPLREKTNFGEKEIQHKVDYFLEAVGLADARDLFPDEISGGMQKRLGIARALALAPKIVLYDDPTAGLDPITSRRIIELILQLRKENGATVVAVTNDMARAYQMADRIAMVVDGQIIVTGNKAQTLAHKDPRVAQFVRGRIEGPLNEDEL